MFLRFLLKKLVADIDNYLITPISLLAQIIAAIMKENHMSFKEWSAAQNAPDKKTKPAADQPKTQPANTPAEVASPPKS
jgi:beta-lactamase regulating signal transducer with metallopeptidase domain